MKKNRRMNTMLIALAVLVVMFAGYQAASSMNAKRERQQEAEEAEKTATVMIADYKYSDMTYLSYCARGEEPIEIKIDSTGNRWMYAKDTTLPLNQTTVAYMANAIASMGAASVVNTDDFTNDAYGFDDPAWTFSVSYKTESNVVHTYKLGNYNEFSKTYYFMEEGVNTLYMIVDGLTSYFEYSLHDLADTGTFPVISEAVFDSVDITVGENTVHLAGDDIKEEMVTLFNLLQPSSFVEYHVTKDTKASYGLDVPRATITANYKETVTYSDSEGATSNATVEQLRSFVISLGDDFTEGDTEYTPYLANGYTFIYSVRSSFANSILSYYYAAQS